MNHFGANDGVRHFTKDIAIMGYDDNERVTSYKSADGITHLIGYSIAGDVIYEVALHGISATKFKDLINERISY